MRGIEQPETFRILLPRETKGCMKTAARLCARRGGGGKRQKFSLFGLCCFVSQFFGAVRPVHLIIFTKKRQKNLNTPQTETTTLFLKKRKKKNLLPVALCARFKKLNYSYFIGQKAYAAAAATAPKEVEGWPADTHPLFLLYPLPLRGRGLGRKRYYYKERGSPLKNVSP